MSSFVWSEFCPTTRAGAEKFHPGVPIVEADDWETMPAGVAGINKHCSVASRSGGKVVGWGITNGDGSFRSMRKG